MPECEVCGLDDFEERDGLFFCTTCQTQTQELIHESEEEDYGETGQPLVDHRLRITQKRDKQPKQKNLEYKGRPWTIYEAYQIILRHQTEAFIRLGAHPKLEEYVFRLWAVYLSKIKVAFTEDEQPYPPVLKKHLRHREKYFGNFENPVVSSVRLVRRHKKTKSTGLTGPVIVGSEDFYEGDDPTQEEAEADEFSSSEDEEEPGLMEDEEADDRTTQQTRSTVNRLMTSRLEWTSLPKLLSLCHLGLLYTNPAVTATDIIRWVEEGEVPYVEVTTLLPDDFQFSSFDPQLFIAQVPKPHALRHLTGNMAFFLDIRKLPPVPLSQLCSRYINVLDLPAEFHGLVMTVLSHHAPQCQFILKSRGAQSDLPFYDALAMAFIILTLKLWFGLDDTTERQLSDYSREAMSMIGGKHDLFVFEEWRAHVSNKLTKMKVKTSLFTPLSSKQHVDLDRVLESYFKTNQHRRRPPRSYVQNRSSKTDGHNRYKQSTKEDLARPFKLAGEKMRSENQKTAFTTQNDAYDGMDDETDVRSENNLGNRENDEIAERGIMFHQSSLKHITNPDTFQDDLDRHELSDDTILSSCVESSSSDDDHDNLMCDEMETMSLQFDFPSPPKRHKSKSSKNAAREAVRKMYKKIHSEKKRPSVQVDMSDLKKMHVCAREHFIMYKRVLLKDRTQSLDAHRHRCYTWIVRLCADIVRCTPYELDGFVTHLCKVYFNLSPQKFNLTNPDVKRFRDKYFADLDEDV